MNDPAQPPPWYRQFWPWFLIALPASAVIGGLATVYIAVQSQDSLVVDDYYKEGLAINQALDREHRAAELGLSGLLRFLPEQSELRITLNGDNATLSTLDHLELHLVHPTRAELDRSLILERNARGEYVAGISAAPAARWYLQLQPASGEWRLTGRLDLSRGGQAALSAGS
ncbi:FixH family protein [Thiohalobacter sp. IOR34]|uniref:FixH family protein n=1 Tax=Thiohalobacter sp. IOR34 TaxID=3057176 RepID=UPI0025AFB15C|nr:FixH family protein [Thiohalobacter sp. IOR34]WJW75635.1 FixH family protein [Thiohalobacter sp. IOR34]